MDKNSVIKIKELVNANEFCCNFQWIIKNEVTIKPWRQYKNKEVCVFISIYALINSKIKIKRLQQWWIWIWPAIIIRNATTVNMNMIHSNPNYMVFKNHKTKTKKWSTSCSNGWIELPIGCSDFFSLLFAAVFCFAID